MSIHTHDEPAVVATVGGVPVPIGEVDAREAELRAGPLAQSLPAAGTSEGRQLRRWLTQLLVTERVVSTEATTLGLTGAGAGDTTGRPDTTSRLDATGVPSEEELLPDETARLEIGSVAAAVLSDPLARALFAHVTAEITVTDDEVAGYHARNPGRFATRERDGHGWLTPPSAPPPLAEVRSAIIDHLRGAARRRAFRVWLDSRRAELVELTPGYEHPGDPRQPDNTHKH